jgi:hypothetical protein
MVETHHHCKNRGYSCKHKGSRVSDRVSVRERRKAFLKRHYIGHRETGTITLRKS